MRNRVKGALRRELRNVRVSDGLRKRILAEAEICRFRKRRGRGPAVPLAVAASLIFMLCAALGMTLRAERPDRQLKVLGQGAGGCVWVSGSDALYHLRPDCGGENLRPVTAAEAAQSGRTACALCGGKTQATEVSPQTRTEAPVRSLPTVEAPESADEADILTDAADRVSETVEEDAAYGSEKSAALADDGGTYLFVKGGRYFHGDEDCAKLEKGKRMEQTAQTLLEARMEPCPLCLPHLREEAGAGSMSSGADLRSAVDPDKYYWVGGWGRYFHSEQKCGELAHERTLTPLALGDARGIGLEACPVCVPEPQWLDEDAACFYATEGGVCYHNVIDCLGMKNARVWSLSALEARGKVPCPVCVIRMVWTSGEGWVYHADEDCAEADGWMWEGEAVQTGRVPCGICTEETRLWVGGDWLRLHTAANCDGMREASELLPREAARLKLELCPLCTGSEIVFVPETGGLYHTGGCPEMNGKIRWNRISLREAEKKEYEPCPVCGNKSEN